MPTKQTLIFAAFIIAAPFLAASARAQNIEPFYASDYTLTNLGTISGLPTSYGPIVFKIDDPQTILIGGDADNDTAGIYEVAVTRDAEGHITGFSGMAVKIANAPGTATHGIDGGLAYGPDEVLFYTTYSDNRCGQIKPGSMDPDKLIDLTGLGVASSTGAVGFVPPGFSGAGRIKFSSYTGHEWYDATVAPDGAGTFNIVGLTAQATLPDNGPDGFAYLKSGHPAFAADSIVQAEYDADLVATYEIDGNGDPVAATRRVLADMIDTGPVGCAFDPITGDLLISNYGADNVYRIRGFLPPDCLTDADADGTADCDDECPDDAAKIAAGDCGCGVADDDGDGDGVADCNDNCPEAANDGQEDADDDGIGDACDEDAPDGQAECCGGGLPALLPLMLLGWRLRRSGRSPLRQLAAHPRRPTASCGLTH